MKNRPETFFNQIMLVILCFSLLSGMGSVANIDFDGRDGSFMNVMDLHIPALFKIATPLIWVRLPDQTNLIPHSFLSHIIVPPPIH